MSDPVSTRCLPHAHRLICSISHMPPDPAHMERGSVPVVEASGWVCCCYCRVRRAVRCVAPSGTPLVAIPIVYLSSSPSRRLLRRRDVVRPRRGLLLGERQWFRVVQCELGLEQLSKLAEETPEYVRVPPPTRPALTSRVPPWGRPSHFPAGGLNLWYLPGLVVRVEQRERQ